jgi:molybdopterin-synthase adenylyltransferase
MGIFSKEELLRYNRQMMLPELGLKGQEKLKAAKVLFVGAGGLGCPALQYLNAAGIGNIGIIDFDRVEIHNLHRQILFNAEDVGRAKAEAAAEKLRRQNPFTQISVYNEMLEERNAEKLIGEYDLVIDGSDNFMTRYLVNDICVKLGKPLVYGSILGFEGQLALFNYKGGKNLRDIFPLPPDPSDVPNCDENGVLGMVPGIIGTSMALLAVEVLLGIYKEANHLRMYDLRTGKQTVVGF